MRDRNGQLVAEPLARGCAKCRLHLELLATAPVVLPSREALLVHVDLETASWTAPALSLLVDRWGAEWV